MGGRNWIKHFDDKNEVELMQKYEKLVEEIKKKN